MDNNQESNLKHDKAYEFAFEKVPMNKRKSFWGLTMVLTGYTVALSNFVIGGNIGASMPLLKAISALLFGNVILVALVVLTGLIAFRTGLSTTFLAKRSLGMRGSHIFSLLLAITGATWVSVNADIFSRMISTTFNWWFIPVPITAILAVILWLMSAVNGYKGLAIVSIVGVPAAIILSAYAFYIVGLSTNGFEGVRDFNPESSVSFSAATSMIIGGWIFGVIITPDVCRFAKRKLHVWISGILAFVFGCWIFQLAGIFIGLSTGEADFVIAASVLGIGLIAFFAAVFMLWTTQDNTIYGASLAIQNIISNTRYFGKIKHIHVVLGIGALASFLAASGIFAYLVPLISFLSILFPPVAGIIIAEEFFVKRPKSKSNVNKAAIFAWLFGGILSYVFLRLNLFIPSIIGILSAGILYLVLEYKKTNAIDSVMKREKAGIG